MNTVYNDSVLLLDKPLTWTSFDVVNKVRYTGKFKKVGHAGTLDPLATGLLILCTGKKTKEIDQYQAQEKEYTGKFILGKTTPSSDLETEVDAEFPVAHIDSDLLEQARIKFIGNISQVPPIFSAIKVKGKRAYESAREGKTVELKAREIEIKSFEINADNFPEISFKVVCSKGTYIRSLARDFGLAVGSGAYLSELRRTKIGDFSVENADTVESFVQKSKIQMKIYNKLSDFKPNGNAIVTTGTFDGVHIGHQLIIKRLMEKAKELGGESVLLTFWPHPRLIISPNENNLKLLTTIDEKTEILETLGIDHFVVLPFSREFSELSSEKYISEILLDGLGTKAMVIGYDHRFGKNREGGIDYLKKHAERFKIEIEEISRQEIENITISSTKIRNAILDGNILVANELLGRPYSFSGPVVKGRQLGRTIGFPTANIQIQKKYKLIPKNGVYATHVFLRNKKYSGIMNIGNRPTVEGHGRSQEVHIFDFSDDIYGETVKIEILDFIREEIKFENVEKLVEQIELDCFSAKQIIAKYA